MIDCPACGKKIKPEANFCNFCGQRNTYKETLPAQINPALELLNKIKQMPFVTERLLAETTLALDSTPDKAKALALLNELTQHTNKYVRQFSREQIQLLTPVAAH